MVELHLNLNYNAYYTCLHSKTLKGKNTIFALQDWNRGQHNEGNVVKN